MTGRNYTKLPANKSTQTMGIDWLDQATDGFKTVHMKRDRQQASLWMVNKWWHKAWLKIGLWVLKQYAVMKTEQNYTKLPANIAIQSAGMDSLKKKQKQNSNCPYKWSSTTFLCIYTTCPYHLLGKMFPLYLPPLTHMIITWLTWNLLYFFFYS